MYSQKDFYFELLFVLAVTVMYLITMAVVTKAYTQEPELRYLPEIYA